MLHGPNDSLGCDVDETMPEIGGSLESENANQFRTIRPRPEGADIESWSATRVANGEVKTWGHVLKVLEEAEGHLETLTPSSTGCWRLFGSKQPQAAGRGDRAR